MLVNTAYYVSRSVNFIQQRKFNPLHEIIFSKIIIKQFFSYEEGRLLISGSLFMFAYILHRRFTFRDFKRVGVAIYANGVENLTGIYERIGQYPDFIHVDIVDESFVKDAEPINYKKYEKIFLTLSLVFFI